MLQLLNPIWLFGISGILIPVVIHLWNIKTGKTLKVGSITLMGESSRQNSRSLKLMELLLLFLRCLLIILLSFLLAGPVWKGLKTAKENKGWILMEKDTFNETYSNFKNEIDSLLDAGEELHLFEPGFKKADLGEILADTTSKDTSAKLSYWSLMKLMEQQIPQGAKAFIYTSDRANRFRGNRPSTSTPINWKTFTPADSISRWIKDSYLTSSGTIRAHVSESNPERTVIKAIDLKPGDESLGVQASITNGKPQVRLNDQTSIADTSALTISVNAEGFLNDAAYLNSAISAIQKYTSRKIKLVKPSSNQDILFWLSPKELPANIQPGTIVFRYAKGKAVSTNTWLKIPNSPTAIKSEDIPVHKRISYPEKNGAKPAWEDGFGQALLDLTKTNGISQYTFYSRLDPEWTDLVWSEEFVKLLLPLIVDEKRDTLVRKLDKRSLVGQEFLPVAGGRAESGKPIAIGLKTEDNENLEFYIWFLLMAVFLIERYISLRNQNI